MLFKPIIQSSNSDFVNLLLDVLAKEKYTLLVSWDISSCDLSSLKELNSIVLSIKMQLRVKEVNESVNLHYLHY